MRSAGALVKKALRINRQGLSRDAIGTAKSHHLLSDVVFIGGTLEQGPHSGLLLVGWIEVSSGAGAFEVSRGNAVDSNGGSEPHRHTHGSMFLSSDQGVTHLGHTRSRIVVYITHAPFGDPRMLAGGNHTMTTITLEVPDELAEALSRAGERLPELLALSLQQPALPAYIYRYILDFLISQPTVEQLAAFGPTPEMTERLQTLLARQAAGDITPAEAAELDEYERIEHLIVMLRAGTLPSLAGAR